MGGGLLIWTRLSGALRPRVIAVVLATAALALLVCGTNSKARPLASQQYVYFTRCGLDNRLSKCDLDRMTEGLAGQEVVPTVAPWYAECAPGGGIPTATVSADGTTALTYEDISAAPGRFGDNAICRLVVTRLATGARHVLPAYSGVLDESVHGGKWSLSPDGRFLAISVWNGVYIQDLQSATPIRLIHTGFFGAGFVGWYPDGSRLLFSGPSVPHRRGEGTSKLNRLFEFSFSGRLLGQWRMLPVNAYQFSASFVVITPTNEIFAAMSVFWDPLFGGKRTVAPPGYYRIHLGTHPSVHLITRTGELADIVQPFGVDSARGVMFISGAVHHRRVICSVSIRRGTRRCTVPTESNEGEFVQLAPPPS